MTEHEEERPTSSPLFGEAAKAFSQPKPTTRDLTAKTTAQIRKQAEPAWELSQHEKLWMETICPKNVPQPLQMVLLTVARGMDFNPLLKEIMVVPVGKNYDGTIRWQIVVGVHGILKKVQQHPHYGGIRSAAVYPGELVRISADGTVIHDFEPTSPQRLTGKPIGAWATVTRVQNGITSHTTKYLRIQDYEKPNSQAWQAMPAHMIETRAKVFAGREAFSDAIGQLYAREEFDEQTE